MKKNLKVKKRMKTIPIINKYIIKKIYNFIILLYINILKDKLNFIKIIINEIIKLL